MTKITFKVTEDEARLIQSLARREQVSVSEYLRRRTNVSAPTSRKPRQVRCPHTGAMIFAAPENQPPLTTESVRELLSDHGAKLATLDTGIPGAFLVPAPTEKSR